ncbi:Ribokinase-like protein [Schizophyllum amplum]|uniref:Adenosine kinase n=1 Tax=Schizophyllum amplum TaxID=97359 RepID=A0A550CS71_9AGAR|nr:Ribokinase-like protein [Auriculariopsis ampla]
MSYKLFCMGDPLLDVQVHDNDLLTRYDLTPNDAILAEDKHQPLYDEIAQHPNATYVAGGGAQTAARGAAYCLPPKSVVYTGCVGGDDWADILRAADAHDGLDEVFLVRPDAKTGGCAVVITDHHRSLVTNHRAARLFHVSHLTSPSVAPLVSAAQVFYVEAFFLNHGLESVLHLATHASSTGKTLALNIGAPYIPVKLGDRLAQVLPHCDIIIANEVEAGSWATANGLPDPKDLPVVARALAMLPKVSKARPRLVIVTHGSRETVVVSSDAPDEPRTFKVPVLKDEDIADTNGAGDAFAGGFLAGYVQGKSLDECVAAGHKLASISISQPGPRFKWPKVNIF